MVVAVSVVVVAQDFRPELDQLIESLDLQSLPAQAFEIVVVDTGSTDGTLERLQKMATRRPNLKVVTGSTEVRPGVPLEECVGEYVLRLEPDQLLFPESLERMYAEAVQNDLDALSCRVAERGAAVPKLWTADEPKLDHAFVPAALDGPAVLMRRSLVELAQDASTDALSESTRVGVLARYAVLRESAASTGDTAGVSLQVDHPAIGWSEGRLQISVAGSVETDATDDVKLSAARPFAVIRETKTGQSFLLGGGDTVTAAPDPADGASWTWNLGLDVDLETVAAGTELPAGVWEIDVQLVGAGDAAVLPVTLPWSACASAVLGRLLVVPAPKEAPTWQLDVGPTTWPLVASPDPADATVTETAAGSQLVLQLSGVHVRGAAAIDGEIALESLRLPAQIVTDGTNARLVGFVSGLQGAPRIGTQFGVVALKQTGLRLEISNVGEMVVATVPPPAPKAAPAPAPAKPVAAQKPAAKKAVPAKKAPAKKAAAKKAVKKPAPKPLTRVQHLRRALPPRLDQVAKKVSKNSLARRVYRKVAKL